MIMRPFDNIGIVLNDNPIEPKHARINIKSEILKFTMPFLKVS
jgi:hypothetical protein